MEERSLCMREARGSIPRTSKFLGNQSEILHPYMYGGVHRTSLLPNRQFVLGVSQSASPAIRKLLMAAASYPVALRLFIYGKLQLCISISHKHRKARELIHVKTMALRVHC
jgi:hypothetical protein